MRNLAKKRREPADRVIKRREIPAAHRASFSKGYWDRVVNRLSYLEVEDVLELVFSPDESISSMKSAIHTAAKRAGVRLRVVIREPRIFRLDTRQTSGDHPPCETCASTLRSVW